MSKKNIRNLSKPEIKRIMNRLGAEQVSNEAKKSLLSLLNNITHQISYDAVKMSKEAGKKTVSEEDVARSAINFVSKDVVLDDFDFEEGELEED